MKNQGNPVATWAISKKRRLTKSSALMSDHRIIELRLSHQVEKMAENQQTVLNLIKNNNNSVAAPKAKTSTGRVG